MVGANFVLNGNLTKPTWEICRPREPCRAASSTSWDLQPGVEPVGTRFAASATYDGKTFSATVTWHGRVDAVTRSHLVSDRRIDAVMIPMSFSLAVTVASERGYPNRPVPARCGSVLNRQHRGQAQRRVATRSRTKLAGGRRGKGNARISGRGRTGSR